MTTDIRSPRYARLFLVLAAINIALYLLQIYKGVDWMKPETTDIIEWGANLAPLTMTGEPWRLFTSMFLHIGIVHIALNIYMLLMCGPIVERAFGSVKFLLIYLISGLFGSLASALWYAQHKVEAVSVFGTVIQGHAQLQLVVAAGASGALMGIAGAFLARSFLLDEVEMDSNHTPVNHLGMRSAFVQTIGINLFMGFANTGVDNACHIGGLLAGAVIGGGLALAGDKQQRSQRIGGSLAIVAGSLALLFYATTMEPSAELLELKTQVKGELEETRNKKIAEQAKAAMLEEIQQDLKTAPAPVDEAAAAGALVPIGELTRDMTVSKDGKRMYVVGSEANFLAVVDLEAKKVIARVDGAPLKPLLNCVHYDCMARRGANAIALSPDERFAYVSSMVDNAVTVIDLKQNQIVTSIPVGGAPQSIKVSGNGKRAYVLNMKGNSVSVLDLGTNTAIGNPMAISEVPDNVSYDVPAELWLANDDKELWVVDPYMHTLAVVDTDSMKITKVLERGNGNAFRAGAVTTKPSSAWIAGYQVLDSIDLKTKTVANTIPFCQEMSRFHMDVNPQNTMIAVSEQNARYVRLVKIKTQTTVGVYPVKGAIDGVRFAADGKRLYVLSNEDNKREPASQALAILDVDKTINIAPFLEQTGELLCTRN